MARALKVAEKTPSRSNLNPSLLRIWEVKPSVFDEGDNQTLIVTGNGFDGSMKFQVQCEGITVKSFEVLSPNMLVANLKVVSQGFFTFGSVQITRDFGSGIKITDTFTYCIAVDDGRQKKSKTKKKS